jgi:RNA polymerase subunit RPABC4/transcription elongation factor Spt4
VTASAFGSVHDFFHSSTWYVIRNLAILFVIVFWVATIYWVYKDARRRIGDTLLVWVATLIGVVPFLGPLVYMLFRPPEYLEDVRERELEIKAMERRLGARELHCPVCRAEIEDDFLVCPVCTTKLRQACARCARPLEAAWQVCPYCETPILTEEANGAAAAAPEAAVQTGRHRRRPRPASS